MDEQVTVAPEPQTVTPVAVEDNSVIDSSPSEPTTSEVQATDGPAESAQTIEPAADETTDTSERPEPRPAERRIRSLVEENKSLKELLDQRLPDVPTSPNTQRFSETLQGQEQFDPADLDTHVEQYAAQRAEQLVKSQIGLLEFKTEQKEALNRLELDTEVLSKEPELDDTKPETFDKDLFQRIEKRWNREGVVPNPANPKLRAINPKVRLADIAREEIAAHRAAIEKGKALASNSVANLADSTAVTPSSDSVPEKDFSQLSAKEMEAVLRAKGYNV